MTFNNMIFFVCVFQNEIFHELYLDTTAATIMMESQYDAVHLGILIWSKVFLGENDIG